NAILKSNNYFKYFSFAIFSMGVLMAAVIPTGLRSFDDTRHDVLNIYPDSSGAKNFEMRLPARIILGTDSDFFSDLGVSALLTSNAGIDLTIKMADPNGRVIIARDDPSSISIDTEDNKYPTLNNFSIIINKYGNFDYIYTNSIIHKIEEKIDQQDEHVNFWISWSTNYSEVAYRRRIGILTSVLSPMYSLRFSSQDVTDDLEENWAEGAWCVEIDSLGLGDLPEIDSLCSQSDLPDLNTTVSPFNLDTSLER
ncbi:MAG: hypothetical protein AAF809_11035, partial [Bacteroidota bacterium]